MARTELLLNGKLGEPFFEHQNDGKLRTAVSWAPWWSAAQENDPHWKNRQPGFSLFTLDGQQVQQVSTPFSTHVGGLWQQVPAAVGNEYELTVEGQAWSSEDTAAASQLEASDVNLQVGIDPTGGLDPFSPLIVWSEKSQSLSHWETLRVTVVSEANIITVYLKSAPNLPKRQQSVFWREAFLRPIGPYKRLLNIVGSGDTHITLEPERPQPGDRITATISSTRTHETVNLLVKLPDREGMAESSETAVLSHGRTLDEGRTIWRYEFNTDRDGLYEVRFVGNGGARLLALRLLQAAREVQIIPAGTPRESYYRVYVLLPPTADQKWFVAAARGGFDGRYTIGFSADDAGIGDLEHRQVLAVNPHHWPQVLTEAWFQQHYPGTGFTAVVANTPEDLEAWLKNWLDE